MLGTKKTLKEQMRENKRMINRSIRELDRERANLERQQEKLIKDIKKAAKEGQMVAFPHYCCAANFPTAPFSGFSSYYGKGFGKDTSICDQVLPDAIPASGSISQIRGATIRCIVVISERRTFRQ